MLLLLLVQLLLQHLLHSLRLVMLLLRQGELLLLQLLRQLVCRKACGARLLVLLHLLLLRWRVQLLLLLHLLLLRWRVQLSPWRELRWRSHRDAPLNETYERGYRETFK